MTWQIIVQIIIEIIIAAIAAFVPIYLYMKRRVRELETNHFEGIKKDIRQVRQEIQALGTVLRAEIATVRGLIDEHKNWHMDHPNPGGTDGV